MLTKSNPPDLPSPSVQTTCASPRSASPPSNKKEKGIFSLVRRGPTERKPMPFSDRSRIMPPFSLPNSTYTNRSGFFRGVSLRSWFMIHLVTRAGNPRDAYHENRPATSILRRPRVFGVALSYPHHRVFWRGALYVFVRSEPSRYLTIR